MKYFILFLFPVLLFAQSNDNLDYFPHKTGDMWEYFYYESPMYVDTAQVFTVFDSTDSDSNIFVTQTSRYINPIQVPAVPFADTMRYRIDTLNQIWGRGMDTDNALLFKLNAKEGDSWIAEDTHNLGGYYFVAKIRRIYEGNIMGELYTIMNTAFYVSIEPDTFGVIVYAKEFAKGLGTSWFGGGETPGSMHLIGAVTDGVLYGDTTDVIVNVENYDNNILPSTFELKQNYPNPFNPGTNIKFMINVSSALSLIIYNIEGKVIKRIIDSRFYNQGTYSVYWNGITQNGNKVPSGVYFYSLISNGKLLKTKSMVLLK